MSITDLNRIAKKNVFYNPTIRKLPNPVQKNEQYYNEQIYAAMFSNFVQILQQHIPRVGQLSSLRMELEQQRKMKEAMGRFIVTLFVLLVSYIYIFSIFKSISASEHIPRGFISLPVIFIFSACILRLIKTNGYPWAFYGLTTNNWKPACKDALFFSTLFIIMLVGLKWLAINYIPALSPLPLIHLKLYGQGTAHFNQHDMLFYILLTCAYILSVPFQELVMRGIIQGTFQDFLSGPHATMWAILISSLLFSVGHIHLSPALAFATLFPSILWGWLYYRHKTLIGVSLSHLLIGCVVFFVLDIKSVFLCC